MAILREAADWTLSSTVWFDQRGDELIFLEVIGSCEVDNAKPSRNGHLVQPSHHAEEAAKYHAAQVAKKVADTVYCAMSSEHKTTALHEDHPELGT
jgi:hypothetical protein